MSSPKKNVAYVFNIALVDSATGDFRANPTVTAGDFKVSGDGAAFANLATLPVVDPTGSIGVKISLSAAEMNFDKIMVQCIDAAGAEWDDVLIFIDATVANVDDVVRSTTPANTLDIAATGEAGVDFGNVVGTLSGGEFAAGVFGADAIRAADVAADAIGASEFATSAVNEIRDAITGFSGPFDLDANGRVRIVDGTGVGELDTLSGTVLLRAATETQIDNIETDTTTDIPALIATAQSDLDTITDSDGVILGAAGVDLIWNELMVGHTTLDSAGEVMNDWQNGGRLDLILDIIANDTTTDIPALIAALNDLSQAEVTGGAYSLDTDANGRIRIVDGTGVGELDTLSGTVLLRAATQTSIDAIEALVAASAIRSAVGLASADLDTQLAALPTANENADALLDRANGIEASVTPRQALRAIAAKAAGLISGAGTGTETIKGIGQASGGTTRLVAAVDSSGNITTWTLSL